MGGPYQTAPSITTFFSLVVVTLTVPHKAIFPKFPNKTRVTISGHGFEVQILELTAYFVVTLYKAPIFVSNRQLSWEQINPSKDDTVTKHYINYNTLIG